MKFAYLCIIILLLLILHGNDCKLVQQTVLSSKFTNHHIDAISSRNQIEKPVNRGKAHSKINSLSSRALQLSESLTQSKQCNWDNQCDGQDCCQNTVGSVTGVCYNNTKSYCCVEDGRILPKSTVDLQGECCTFDTSTMNYTSCPPEGNPTFTKCNGDTCSSGCKVDSDCGGGQLCCSPPSSLSSQTGRCYSPNSGETCCFDGRICDDDICRNLTQGQQCCGINVAEKIYTYCPVNSYCNLIESDQFTVVCGSHLYGDKQTAATTTGLFSGSIFVPPPETDDNGKNLTLILAIAIPCGVVLIIIITVAVVCVVKRKQRREKRHKDRVVLPKMPHEEMQGYPPRSTSTISHDQGLMPPVPVPLPVMSFANNTPTYDTERYHKLNYIHADPSNSTPITSYSPLPPRNEYHALQVPSLYSPRNSVASNLATGTTGSDGTSSSGSGSRSASRSTTHQQISLAPSRNIIRWDEVETVQSIGKGSFGEVYQAKWHEAYVAVKLIHPDLLEDQSVTSNFYREIEILKNLIPHPNTILFYGVTNEPASIVMEYCQNGSLYYHLHSSVDISLEAKRRILLGVARGMSHLHFYNVIHRDLAARNILLMQNWEVKVSDFGFSRILSEQEDKSSHANRGSKTDTDVGPVRWLPPEAIKNRSFSIKTDIWSFGVVVYEVLTRKDPFGDKSITEVILGVSYEGLRLEIPENCPPQFAKLMNLCFQSDPVNRPTFKEICAILESESIE